MIIFDVLEITGPPASQACNCWSFRCLASKVESVFNTIRYGKEREKKKLVHDTNTYYRMQTDRCDFYYKGYMLCNGVFCSSLGFYLEVVLFTFHHFFI